MADGRSFVTSFVTNYSNKGIDKMKQELGDLKKAMADNRREQKSLSKEIRDSKTELKLIENQIKESGQATEEQTRRIKELTASIEVDSAALDKLKQEQAKLKSQMNETTA